MKTRTTPQLFVMFFLGLISLNLNAQDRIITHSKDTTICSVVEILEETVRFKYQGESLVNNIPFSSVSKIILGSGRVINGPERIIIRGVEDRGKVKFALNSDEVSDLELVSNSTVTKKSSMVGSYANLIGLKEEAKEMIVDMAIKHRAHLILIISDDSREGRRGTSNWPEAIFNVNFYRHKGIQCKSDTERALELIETEEIDELENEDQEYYVRKIVADTKKRLGDAETNEDLLDINKTILILNNSKLFKDKHPNHIKAFAKLYAKREKRIN